MADIVCCVTHQTLSAVAQSVCCVTQVFLNIYALSISYMNPNVQRFGNVWGVILPSKYSVEGGDVSDAMVAFIEDEQGYFASLEKAMIDHRFPQDL